MTAFAIHLSVCFRLAPTDVEPTETPGYWRVRRECRGECREGHARPMHHTIQFLDGARDRGRFASPFATWRTARAALGSP